MTPYFRERVKSNLEKFFFSGALRFARTYPPAFFCLQSVFKREITELFSVFNLKI